MHQANVYFVKEVEQDNWSDGCTGSRIAISDGKFQVEFENTEDLKKKLAERVSSWFGVDEDKFLEYVENEIENNRFDYCQNEDDNGKYTNLTEENPNGWLADYTFYVEVFRKVDYQF